MLTDGSKSPLNFMNNVVLFMYEKIFHKNNSLKLKSSFTKIVLEHKLCI